MIKQINVIVNGESYQMEVPAHRTLLDFLRQDLELMGTKSGCETGDCGACTVLLSGAAVNSCLVLAVEADGKEVLTVEGLAYPNGDLHPLQEALPRPTEKEIKEALAGNLCRCTGYYSTIKAVQAAAERINR